MFTTPLLEPAEWRGLGRCSCPTQVELRQRHMLAGEQGTRRLAQATRISTKTSRVRAAPTSRAALATRCPSLWLLAGHPPEAKRAPSGEHAMLVPCRHPSSWCRCRQRCVRRSHTYTAGCWGVGGRGSRPGVQWAGSSRRGEEGTMQHRTSAQALVKPGIGPCRHGMPGAALPGPHPCHPRRWS